MSDIKIVRCGRLLLGKSRRARNRRNDRGNRDQDLLWTTSQIGHRVRQKRCGKYSYQVNLAMLTAEFAEDARHPHILRVLPRSFAPEASRLHQSYQHYSMLKTRLPKMSSFRSQPRISSAFETPRTYGRRYRTAIPSPICLGDDFRKLLCSSRRGSSGASNRWAVGADPRRCIAQCSWRGDAIQAR